VRTLRRRGDGYPPLLAAIHDPPAFLHVRGDAEVAVLSGTTVGIVGARSCSSYGRTVARTLARELAAAGVVIVSGMARGVDAEAHRGALDAGGVTVAVLGCGVDRDYPASHAELARRICERGLIVSEYAPGVPPAPWRFPARNRIIAGLSKVVVVTEARDRSGALITADFALQEGREVMVVPGEITSALSAGTNALLRLGAAPVLGVADVAAALGINVRPAVATDLGPDARVVLAAVSAGATAADELARVTGLGAARVAAALSELELAQVVRIEEGAVRSSIDV
jgi:DNA processing protein